MNPRPTRETIARCAYNDLRNLAKRHGRDVAEYFALYTLEGFLVRLAASRFVDQLVLKGGMLMAAFSARHPTRGIDVAVSGLPNDVAEATERVKVIAAIGAEDGLRFDAASIRGELIRDEADYQGVRVHLTAHLAKVKNPLHVDMSFGDPVWPAPTPTKLPRLLGGQIELLGYPVTIALAEKIVTAIERGAANTRWRDFTDIASIAATREVSADDLTGSITVVAEHRHVETKALVEVLDGMAPVAQPKWAAWRRKQRFEDSTPESFQQLLDACPAFADPVLTVEALGRRWSPSEQTWH